MGSPGRFLARRTSWQNVIDRQSGKRSLCRLTGKRCGRSRRRTGDQAKTGAAGKKANPHCARRYPAGSIALSQIRRRSVRKRRAWSGSRDPSIGWKNLCAGRWNDHHIFFDGTRDQPDGRSGTQILIHVGVDTVQLSGMGFSPKKKQGDRIKTGELLLEARLLKHCDPPVTQQRRL